MLLVYGIKAMVLPGKFLYPRDRDGHRAVVKLDFPRGNTYQTHVKGYNNQAGYKTRRQLAALPGQAQLAGLVCPILDLG